MISANDANHSLPSLQTTHHWLHNRHEHDRPTVGSFENVRSGRPSTLSETQSPMAGIGFVASCAVLGLIGLGISGYLGYVGLTASKVIGCDGGLFNCDHVLTSRWSTVFGIPVSLPAVGLYGLVLVAIANLRSSVETRRRVAASVVWVSAVAASTTAAWFVSLQVFSIGHICPYCLIVHSCGLLLTGLLIWRRLGTSLPLSRLIPLGVLASVGLVTAQALSPVPETFMIETHEPAAAPLEFDPLSDEPILESRELFDAPTALLANPFWSLIGVVAADETSSVSENASATTESAVPPRMVLVSGGRRQLDARKWPVWGNVEAKYMVVEMFDYTCSHCRNTHAAIRSASTLLGNEFAVLTLPVPLHRDCNDAATSSSLERADACEIARLAISVWLVEPSQFTIYHDWLFGQSRTASEARAYAESLVGRQRLADELAKGTASKYIAKNVLLYKDAGAGTVPKIILPSTIMVGEVGSGSTIADMVRQQLGQ